MPISNNIDNDISLHLKKIKWKSVTKRYTQPPDENHLKLHTQIFGLHHLLQPHLVFSNTGIRNERNYNRISFSLWNTFHSPKTPSRLLEVHEFQLGARFASCSLFALKRWEIFALAVSPYLNNKQDEYILREDCNRSWDMLRIYFFRFG